MIGLMPRLPGPPTPPPAGVDNTTPAMPPTPAKPASAPRRRWTLRAAALVATPTS